MPSRRARELLFASYQIPVDGWRSPRERRSLAELRARTMRL
jgi:hypothetical protein